MSSEIARSSDSSSIKKEEALPPDSYRDPSSALSVWVLTFDASYRVDQFFAIVTLPIPPEYLYRQTIKTGGGFGILRPRGAQITGVIGVYPSEAAAKYSGRSWIHEQLKDR